MDPHVSKVYGNRIRVRVCGLCWENGKLLMVNHSRLTSGNFWAPPGGGLEFGESVEQCLQKEFLEETGLQISRGKFLFGCEYINNPLHAVELFFEVNVTDGALSTGDDPEMPIIRDVRYLSKEELATIPPEHLHGIFRLVSNPEQFMTLNGFFRI